MLLVIEVEVHLCHTNREQLCMSLYSLKAYVTQHTSRFAQTDEETDSNVKLQLAGVVMLDLSYISKVSFLIKNITARIYGKLGKPVA